MQNKNIFNSANSLDYRLFAPSRNQVRSKIMPKSCKAALLTYLLILLPIVGNASQICQPTNIPATTPSTRFSNHPDGTVTDSKTGLMWKKCSEGQNGSDCSDGSATLFFGYSTALQHVQTINNGDGFAGKADWRLPNVKELSSILEGQCYSPAVNLTVFPNTVAGDFWSSSPVAKENERVWYVNFNFGFINWGSNNNYVHQPMIRLVRDSQAVPPVSNPFTIHAADETGNKIKGSGSID